MSDDAYNCLGYVKCLPTDEGYSIGYNGGRLADVLIMGVAVECVPVRELAWRSGEFGREPSNDEIRAKVKEWLDPEDMDNYRELARHYALTR